MIFTVTLPVVRHAQLEDGSLWTQKKVLTVTGDLLIKTDPETGEVYVDSTEFKSVTDERGEPETMDRDERWDAEAELVGAWRRAARQEAA